MSLFQLGDFTLSSGLRSSFKINCDVLTDKDWNAVARIAWKILLPFNRVEGVPTGGLAFAKAMKRYATSRKPRVLICDDVLTTGASMEKVRAGRNAIGIVVFARGPCPSWVTPIFRMETP